MNATELFHANGKTACIFYCATCRIVARDRQHAEECCKPILCEDCQAPALKYYSVCQACKTKCELQRESERLAKAEKAIVFDGPIYIEGMGYSDGYFADLESLEDYLASEEEDDGTQPNRPRYAWCCETTAFCQLDFDSIIENATQEAYEDWDGEVDGAEALKAAIETFNEANKGLVSWHPAYNRALIIQPLEVKV